MKGFGLHERQGVLEGLAQAFGKCYPPLCACKVAGIQGEGLEGLHVCGSCRTCILCPSFTGFLSRGIYVSV